MTRDLPPLRVIENRLPHSHPGSAYQSGTLLAPRNVGQEAEVELADLYAPLAAADPDLPHVRANFITTLDGSVIGGDGKSGSINGPADLRVFQLLRAQADAVFVGAGTVRIERYQDTDIPTGLQKLRSNPGPQMVTVTRTGDLQPEFLATNPIVITAQDQPAAQKLASVLPPENLLICGKEVVDFRAALQQLRRRGFKEILCEGGPHLMGALLENGLVGELCLSISPKVMAGPGSRLAAGSLVPTAARLQVMLSAPDGYLMSRWLLQPEAPSAD